MNDHYRRLWQKLPPPPKLPREERPTHKPGGRMKPRDTSHYYQTPSAGPSPFGPEADTSPEVPRLLRRRTDTPVPVRAIRRWWAVAAVVGTLVGGGFYAASYLRDGYATRDDIQAVRESVRDLEDDVGAVKEAVGKVRDSQDATSRRIDRLGARMDWMIEQEIESARRDRRRQITRPAPQ